MRATTATHAGCVQRGMGQTTAFSRRGSSNAAEDDSRPNIIQLNTEGLTDNKIFDIEQWAYKNKAFIVVLQETHCTTADKLVIPNFSRWFNPEQELRPCHVCPRAVGIFTGRSVSRTIRDWVGVRRRRRLQDRQRLQTSTLATNSNNHPDVPTHQSVRWRLQLPAFQLGLQLQHDIPGRWEPGLLGNIQQPWTVVQPKGSSLFIFSPLERRHQPRPGLRKFQPRQPTARQTCPTGFPQMLTRNSLKISSKFPKDELKIPKIS